MNRKTKAPGQKILEEEFAYDVQATKWIARRLLAQAERVENSGKEERLDLGVEDAVHFFIVTTPNIDPGKAVPGKIEAKEKPE